ncbi:DNA polymerase III subunit epsilon [Francisellaceae bacterium]|nr:DNA polymerase III subunit epsilon [Francisellaceae bacterium]
MRQIFLDTETTGFDYKNGHRVIEFGAVEMVGRKLTENNLHFYFKPDIKVDEGALRVHGLSNDFLADKPLFESKAKEIIDYLKGAEVIIHNAAFDVPFLDSELGRLPNNSLGKLEDHISVLDSLIMARKKHPGQRNSLDALCKRYGVNNQHRLLHGALLDAEILADVYLAMTGGQIDLMFQEAESNTVGSSAQKSPLNLSGVALKIVQASDDALALHEAYMANVTKKSGQVSLWENLEK